MLLGHISELQVRPLYAKAVPATAPARQLPVQRRARKYMPIPAKKRWPRQNTPSDHDSGKSR